MSLDPSHIRWLKNIFDLLAIGGVWGFPNAGLVFQKIAPTTVICIGAMPFQEGMPGTPEEWKEHQEENYQLTVTHAIAAGYILLDRRNAQ